MTPGPWGLSLPPAQSPRTPRNTHAWYLQHGKNSSVSFRHLSIRKGKKITIIKNKPFFFHHLKSSLINTCLVFPSTSYTQFTLFQRNRSTGETASPQQLAHYQDYLEARRQVEHPAFPQWGCARRGANAAAPEICAAPARVHAPLGLCWPWCGVWHCGQHNLTRSTTATSHPDSQQTHHEEVSSLLTDCLTRGPSPQGRMFLSETFALQYRAADRCTKARDCDILSTPRQI